jgi:hypothetical protein
VTTVVTENLAGTRVMMTVVDGYSMIEEALDTCESIESCLRGSAQEGTAGTSSTVQGTTKTRRRRRRMTGGASTSASITLVRTTSK